MCDTKNDMYTFYSLISQYNIEIPVIQRDYAQGRETPKAKSIRKDIVSSMLKAVLYENEEDKLFFDFVYGKIIDSTDTNGKKIFNPFDGQQRLTALFLLYLYLFKKFECNDCNFLNGFTYATRKSSVEFCRELVKENIIPDSEVEMSVYIKNSSWFFMDWNNDPTVTGMLAMLDEIDAQFRNLQKKRKIDKDSIIENLENSNCIRFHFLNMQKYDLTDEIYIKMNSRGKHLTGFENFKAYLEEYLGTKDAAYAQRFKGKYDEEKRVQTGIDGLWTDNFFRVQQKLKGSTKQAQKLLPDSLIHSFINRYLINVWNVWCTQNKKATDEEISRQIALRIDQEFKLFPDDDTFVSWDLYQFIFDKCGLEETLLPLMNFFDYMGNNLNSIRLNSQSIWDRNALINKWNLFSGISDDNNEETYPSRIAFYALIKYFKNEKYDESKLGDWMRIIWNVIENSRIDDKPPYQSALQLVNTLSTKSVDINTGLGNDFESFGLGNSYHAKNQVDEEVIKAAKIISDDGSWKKTIEEAESDSILHGTVRVLFQNGKNTSYKQFNERYALLKAIVNNSKDEFHFVKVLISHYSSEKIKEKIYLVDYNRIKNWKKEIITNVLADCFQRVTKDEIVESDYLWIKDISQTTLLNSATRNDGKKSKAIGNYGNEVILWGTAGCKWITYGNNIDGNVVIGNKRNQLLSATPGIKSDQRIGKTVFFKNKDIYFTYKNNNFMWCFDNDYIYALDDSGEYLTKISDEHKLNDTSIPEELKYYCCDTAKLSNSLTLTSALNTVSADWKQNAAELLSKKQ
jgi:hypothetical protein